MYFIGSKDNSDGGRTSVSVKACPPLDTVKHKCNICGDITCHCVIPSDSKCASSGRLTILWQPVFGYAILSPN